MKIHLRKKTVKLNVVANTPTARAPKKGGRGGQTEQSFPRKPS